MHFDLQVKDVDLELQSSDTFHYDVSKWERNLDFNPEKVNCYETETWVTVSGGAPSFTAQNVSAELVLEGADFDLKTLILRDPNLFVAGQLGKNKSEWEYVMAHSGMDEQILTSVRKWLGDGVDIVEFFTHFKGNFKGKPYDSEKPPTVYFQIAPGCKKYGQFICDTLYQKIRSGAIRVLGKVGECCPPHVVMPLVVEPSKPRLCHDDRFLNLWVRDLPFKLDTLRDVHRLVRENAVMVTTDDKSGYDHVRLSSHSQEYFGLEFGGYFMVYTVLPFGFKASPYIYQMIGMVVTSYLRSRSVITVQYIDDRLVVSDRGGIQEGRRVAYVLLQVLTRLGYTLSLEKCSLVPSTCVKYLGFWVDSVRQAYILPEEKKHKFLVLREAILASSEVTVKTLQRFAGKCISIGLAVPGAKLYCREVNLAISHGVKNSRLVPVVGMLKSEVEQWRFLDNWEGCARWKTERHRKVVLSTDASLFKYGAVVEEGEKNLEISDFWDKNDTRPIHLKEAEAVYRVLKALGGRLVDSRVQVFTDNMAVLGVWKSQGARDSALNQITKSLFALTLDYNFELNMQYVPSGQNMADAPSRSISYTDSMLSEKSWERVEKTYGPHTVDLMAADSNAMTDKAGEPLRHFTPCPMPQSAGVDLFAQDLKGEVNCYVFPPFGMIFPVLAFLREQRMSGCTCVLPDFQPRPQWFPLLEDCKVSSVVLGEKGDRGVLRVPTKRGFVEDGKGLKWSLIAYRLSFLR